jgi:hypothetical protein
MARARDQYAALRVEWRNPASEAWEAIGPWFETLHEANAFASSLAPLGRQARVVRARGEQLVLDDRGSFPEGEMRVTAIASRP